jgi:hypothetical protein
VREALTMWQPKRPNDLRHCHTQSLLGESLLRQKENADTVSPFRQ